MKATGENKMAHADDDGCGCTTCRVRRAGLGWGPYTPDEYAKIAPPMVSGSAGVDVANDPAVKRAEQAADALQAEYEKSHDKWISAVAEAQSATLVAKSQPMVITHTGTALYPGDSPAKVARGRELDEAANELRTQRDRVHGRWMKAVADRDNVVRRARWRAEQE